MRLALLALLGGLGEADLLPPPGKRCHQVQGTCRASPGAVVRPDVEPPPPEQVPVEQAAERRLSSQSEADPCEKYLSEQDCSWTMDYGCPGQPKGAQGDAADDGTDGYKCCCLKEAWKQFVANPGDLVQQASTAPAEKENPNPCASGEVVDDSITCGLGYVNGAWSPQVCCVPEGGAAPTGTEAVGVTCVMVSGYGPANGRYYRDDASTSVYKHENSSAILETFADDPSNWYLDNLEGNGDTWFVASSYDNSIPLGNWAGAQHGDNLSDISVAACEASEATTTGADGAGAASAEATATSTDEAAVATTEVVDQKSTTIGGENIVGGPSESREPTPEDLDVWTRVLAKYSTYDNVDLASLGQPVSVVSQVVSGVNYDFTFSDGTVVSVFEQKWTDTLEIQELVPSATADGNTTTAEAQTSAPSATTTVSTVDDGPSATTTVSMVDDGPSATTTVSMVDDGPSANTTVSMVDDGPSATTTVSMVGDGGEGTTLAELELNRAPQPDFGDFEDKSQAFRGALLGGRGKRATWGSDLTEWGSLVGVALLAGALASRLGARAARGAPHGARGDADEARVAMLHAGSSGEGF